MTTDPVAHETIFDAWLDGFLQLDPDTDRADAPKVMKRYDMDQLDAEKFHTLGPEHVGITNKWCRRCMMPHGTGSSWAVFRPSDNWLMHIGCMRDVGHFHDPSEDRPTRTGYGPPMGDEPCEIGDLYEDVVNREWWLKSVEGWTKLVT